MLNIVWFDGKRRAAYRPINLQINAYFLLFTTFFSVYFVDVGRKSVNALPSVLSHNELLRDLAFHRRLTMSDALHFVSNRILAALPRDDYLSLSHYLRPVSLPAGRILSEAGVPIRTAYFITGGLACTLTMTLEGLAVATLLTGSEGFVGVPLILEDNSWPFARTLMLVPGFALTIEAARLQRHTNDTGPLSRLLKRYVMRQMVEVMQNAACARLHSIEERLACCLLMASDRLGTQFVMTHETMGQIIGNRRATVSLEAEKMQRLGQIKYVHGRVHILSRPGLEKMACECYEIVCRCAALF